MRTKLSILFWIIQSPQIFLNGKVVNEYSGDTVPGTEEFNSSTIWEKNTQNINWQK